MTDSIKSNTKQLFNQATGQYDTVTVSKTSTDHSKFTVKQYSYNNDAYDVAIVLDNGTQQIGISPQAVVYLQIEDTLSNWYMTGQLVVQFNTEALENGAKPPTNNNTLDTYNFRNDGFDFLKINILPVDPVSRKKGASFANLPQELIELNSWFSIYDIEDLNTPGDSDMLKSVVKHKKFYFRDYRQQKFETTYAEYSTSLSPKLSALPSVVPDSARSLATGDILHELIQSLDVDAHLKRTALDLPVPATAEWDQGCNTLFFTAGATQTLSDAMMYVLDRHAATEGVTYGKSVGNDQVAAPSTSTTSTSATTTLSPPSYSVAEIHDVCLLTLSRGPEKGDYGYFTLKPISKFFEQAGKSGSGAGPLQYEHFLLQTPTTTTPTAGTNTYLAPVAAQGGLVNHIKDLTIAGRGTIKNYRFVDVSAEFNSKDFVSRPVCSFNFQTRNYTIAFENHTVELARKFIAEFYIDQLFTAQGEREKKFLLNINDDKVKKKNVKYVSSLYGGNSNQQLCDGIHHLLYNGLFQNACINFDLVGETFREPGTFIGIDRPTGGDPN